MKKSILKKDRRYTFSDYFELNYTTEDILIELDYAFKQEALQLPVSKEYDVTTIERLRNNYYHLIPKISINSEIAKREFLIAPILAELALASSAKINVEYSIDVSDKLCGSLDYLVHAKKNLVVIGAKKGDLDKGFTQLAVELIAVEQYYHEEDRGENLYGAITIGDVWRFGVLRRDERCVVKDINSYTVPGDVHKVFEVLLGVVG